MCWINVPSKSAAPEPKVPSKSAAPEPKAVDNKTKVPGSKKRLPTPKAVAAAAAAAPEPAPAAAAAAAKPTAKSATVAVSDQDEMSVADEWGSSTSRSRSTAEKSNKSYMSKSSGEGNPYVVEDDFLSQMITEDVVTEGEITKEEMKVDISY